MKVSRLPSNCHPSSLQANKRKIAGRINKSGSLWPVSVVVHLTDVCNHKCEWCWYSRSKATVEITDVIALLELCHEHGMAEVIVSGGGEPLLHSDIALLLEYLRSSGIESRKLYTNGSRLDRFPQIGQAFNHVRVSLDAGGAELYSKVHGVNPAEYVRILESLKQASVNAPLMQPGVSMVVTQQTEFSISELLDDCAIHGLKFVVLKPLLGRKFRDSRIKLDIKNIPADVSVMSYSESVRGLPAGRLPVEVAASSLMIASNGWVYPCCHLDSDNWRISPAQVKDLGQAIGSPRHLQILRDYTNEVHDCTAFHLWIAEQSDNAKHVRIQFNPNNYRN